MFFHHSVWGEVVLDKAECKISAVHWQWKLVRIARSSNAPDLQTGADAEEELTYIRVSLWELLGGMAPLKN